MKPEQLMGEPVEAQSDLYAMGLIGYEHLAGRHPFASGSFTDLLESQICKEPPPLAHVAPEAPAPLLSALHRALARSPAARPASAEVMIEDMRATARAAAAPSAAPAAPSAAASARPRDGGVVLNRCPGGPSTAAVTQVIGAPPPAARPRWLRALAIGLALLGGACLVLAVQTSLLVCGWREPRLLEQAHDVESTWASISWRTDRGCFSQIEYWQACGTQTKLRTRRVPIVRAEHRQKLPDLKPDTAYNFRLLFSYPAAEEGESFASEVFNFTTRPEIEIFNIHVDEYTTKAVITWETNLRTDTTVKYGKTDQYEDLQTNPDQRSETIHSITIAALAPVTTYHYQILASDPRGRGQRKPSEDLEFRTSQESELGRFPVLPNGRVDCSFADGGTLLAPDEREKLKAAIQRNPEPRAVLSAPEKKLLLATPTNEYNIDEFNNRTQMSRIWLNTLKREGKPVDSLFNKPRLLQELYFTNQKQAVTRLDQLFMELDALDR